ncbi:RNase P modulator RnpM [Paenibacillus koleovorans]|uniref:RNase P modulator RnpM n=1 Tax=Paenibacillus koleovorans TaxID=121608 RepID=UPI000FD8DB6D|nr:YlxR family protein [Paenibacillus koleovorans]
MKPRKIPQRKCIVCQHTLTKKEMVRVVRTPEGAVEVDVTGKKNGRGAYLCGKMEGFLQAKKTKAFDRALKVSMTPEDYERLEQDFNAIQARYATINCGRNTAHES